MGNITLLDYEADLEGGWFVHWNDDANGDGQPLTAFFHLTPAWIEEMIFQRSLLGFPVEAWQDALDTLVAEVAAVEALQTPPVDTLAQKVAIGVNALLDPPSVVKTLRVYADHVNEGITRIQLGILGNTPYEVYQEIVDGGILDIPRKYRAPVDTDESFNAYLADKSELSVIGVLPPVDTLYASSSRMTVTSTSPFAITPGSSTIGVRSEQANVDQQQVVVPNNAKMETKSDGTEPYSEYPRPKTVTITPAWEQIGTNW